MKIKLRLSQPEKRQVKISTDTIRLDAALKFSNAVCTGGQAKMVILDSLVRVNGEICTMRGKKLSQGDSFQYEGIIYEIV